MRTTLQPPNITLPEEALQKLYAKALRNGMSLKTYIEGLLIEEANAPSFARRVSPSADAWFDHPQNIAAVRRGLQQQAAGLAQTFSIEEIKRLVRPVNYRSAAAPGSHRRSCLLETIGAEKGIEENRGTARRTQSAPPNRHRQTRSPQRRLRRFVEQTH